MLVSVFFPSFLTGSHPAVQLRLAWNSLPRLTLNPRISSCLSLPRARILGVSHYTWMVVSIHNLFLKILISLVLGTEHQGVVYGTQVSHCGAIVHRSPLLSYVSSPCLDQVLPCSKGCPRTCGPAATTIGR